MANILDKTSKLNIPQKSIEKFIDSAANEIAYAMNEADGETKFDASDIKNEMHDFVSKIKTKQDLVNFIDTYQSKINKYCSNDQSKTKTTLKKIWNGLKNVVKFLGRFAMNNLPFVLTIIGFIYACVKYNVTPIEAINTIYTAIEKLIVAGKETTNIINQVSDKYDEIQKQSETTGEKIGKILGKAYEYGSQYDLFNAHDPKTFNNTSRALYRDKLTRAHKNRLKIYKANRERLKQQNKPTPLEKYREIQRKRNQKNESKQQVKSDVVLSKMFKQVFVSESKKQFPKTIALVSGSMKFPTIAHWYMIEQYAKQADKVIVIVSDPKNKNSIRKTSTGIVITPQMSKDILDIYVKCYGLSNKINVIISPEPSPIAAMFKYVDEKLNDVNVIFGVSKKAGDEKRFKSAMKYYADNEHINLLDPLTTAVDPYLDEKGNPVSATDARNSLDDPEKLKTFLPKKLTKDDIQKVFSILKVKTTNESKDISRNNLESCDETEAIHLNINDDILSKAKIIAYNVGQTITNNKGKDIPITPKKFPEKAIDIVFPVQQLLVEVYLDTKTKKWDSNINYNNQQFKLSPDQFGQFFNSNFYKKLMLKLKKSWPLTDKLYGNLYEGILNKEMLVNSQQLSEDDDSSKDSIKQDEKPRKYTASGRKIVHFSDMNVNSKESKFLCWPNMEKLYNWSTWKDWKKIKPLCRIRFKHGEYFYGLSLSPVKDDYKNRGFKGYNLTLEPKLQWLTKEENEQVMKLSIVDKFIKQCISKIEDALSHKPEEIYEKINNKDKITIEEIAATQNIIRKTLNNIIKPRQIDNFKWS